MDVINILFAPETSIEYSDREGLTCLSLETSEMDVINILFASETSKSPERSRRQQSLAGTEMLQVPVHNKVISGFQALRQARAPVTGLEPATEGSLQISGRTR
ncbi:hypothetical protein PoB_000615000 [Plakobranchus ocellatus]|uniref:Uncharacterized protein n=1 Tax=Plakobranchus ocellatus TaxID=259542 RepID=A0AAV3YAV9_9GAST|nr:hypothetical protein PoB_000615000 [Plakobranchus ocellatus]